MAPAAVLNEAALVAREAELAAAYRAGAPYPHGCLEAVCPPAALRAVREELVGALPMEPKETDLYALRQSPDLANLGALFDADPAMRSRLPTVEALRAALYSESFRGFVSRLTGAGPLGPRPDLAFSCYTDGSHLLNHDDVIGTRKVSFIIYLSEPAPEWTAADGGALELYGHDADGCPLPAPAARLLPRFNRMALFTVEAGVSFHAVQEVYGQDRERLSIQGWYHTADAAAAPAAAAGTLSVRQLRRLKAETGAAAPGATGQPLPGAQRFPWPSEGEIATHRRVALEGAPVWPSGLMPAEATERLRELGVHPMHLDHDNMALMAAAFRRDGVLRLGEILVPQLAEPLNAALRAADAADGLGLGQPCPPADDAGAAGTAAWTVAGPAHVRRHLALASDVDAALAAAEEPARKKARGDAAAAAAPAAARGALATMLEAIRDRLLASEAFLLFVAALTGLDVTPLAVTARRFRPGLDYTLSTVPAAATELDVTLTFCNDPELDTDSDEEDESAEAEEAEEAEEEAEEGVDLWKDCEVGGFDCYIHAEDDTEGGAVMAGRLDAGADGRVRSMPCQNNCLNIVLRRPDTMTFVKYLQAAAPSSRVDAHAVLATATSRGVYPPGPEGQIEARK